MTPPKALLQESAATPSPPLSLDALFSKPPFAEAIEAPTLEQWEAMSARALANDWPAYLLSARAHGSFSPSRPIPPNYVPDHGVRYSFEFSDAFFHALERHGDPRSMLDSARAFIPDRFMGALINALLARGSESMFSSSLPEGLPALLMSYPEADPRLGAASGAALMGDVPTLRAMLLAGMDPNGSQSPGSMPLIFSALSKERAFSMSDKMACAKMLLDYGARVSDAFDPHEVPSSLLELALMGDAASKSPCSARSGLALFDFPWNYFDESGVSVEDLLPLPGDLAGHHRVLSLMEAKDSFSDILSTRRVFVDPEGYPWLRAAIDLIELRLSTPSGSFSRKPPTL